MNVSLIQLRIGWEGGEANRRNAAALIGKAAEAGADLVCLPELFSTGVTLESRRFAESARGETCSFLRSQAVEHGVYVVGSFIEENERGLPYNTSITYTPRGKVAAKYHKTHLFTHGGEDKGYSLGEPEVSTFKAGGFAICPLICYDLRFPEMFQAALDVGADLFLIQANWPNPRRMHWETLLVARAVECQAYVAGVNQVGESPRNTFFGASRVISPRGETVAKAGGRQQVLSATLSPEEVAENRRKYPFLKERRRIRRSHGCTG
jgi:predicted amidohydrolase